MIDVLIPTYNPKPEHLTAALQGLQAQKLQDWRALVHDDCSPNGNTAEIVQPFLVDTRITFVQSPARQGIGGNWNACVQKTHAPIVAFLFQDDIWEPHYLESALKVLNEHSSVGFVSLEHEYHTEGGMDTGPLYEGLKEDRSRDVTAGVHAGSEFLRTWITKELTPNLVGEPDFVVMRRSVMQQAGAFHNKMPQFLDVEYWIRLLQITNWYFLTGNYGSFRVHPSGTSAMNQASGKGMYDRLECFEELVGALKGEDRALAIHARNHALQNMVAKFFTRMKSGKKVTGGGSGARKFAMKHPVLMLGAILRYGFSSR